MSTDDDYAELRAALASPRNHIAWIMAASPETIGALVKDFDALQAKVDAAPGWSWLRAVGHLLVGGGYGIILGACGIHYTTWQFWALMGIAAAWATGMRMNVRERTEGQMFVAFMVSYFMTTFGVTFAILLATCLSHWALVSAVVAALGIMGLKVTIHERNYRNMR